MLIAAFDSVQPNMFCAWQNEIYGWQHPNTITLPYELVRLSVDIYKRIMMLSKISRFFFALKKYYWKNFNLYSYQNFYQLHRQAAQDMVPIIVYLSNYVAHNIHQDDICRYECKCN